MLPPSIPLFPLPNVVLFPNVFLPLHIFEPRYRAMVAHALQEDRIIGMTLLRPGYEANYDGCPAIYPIGCAGVITHNQSLGDGRYDIVLRGMQKFRIRSEDHSRPYRIGHVEGISEMVPPDQAVPLRQQRQRLEAVLAAAIERVRAEPKFPPSVPDEDLVNALAQYLDLDVLEHQALLECDGVLARCRALIDLLEMKLHAPQGGWSGKVFH
ncbi:MAG TPA: LON peptidase substrate-binding domain-containing protein [Vicinamibacterales bacterium]|nr:LON peptidase substrate-binding domain-containing protein [Vicinamibacterales bacterium]